MGRPTKLTPGVEGRVVEAVLAGCYREQAAQVAGVTARTLYSWLERGEADAEAERATPYRQFFHAIKRAEAEAEEKDLSLIERAAIDGSWQAAAWRLERKHPERWARRERDELQARRALEAELAELRRMVAELVPEHA